MGGGSGIEGLLYDGEEVTLRAGGADPSVVVTTHRVLAFTPEGEGPNYRPLERPNVLGVARRSTGGERWLLAGLKALFVGLALLAGGVVVDLDGVLGAVDVGSAPGGTGLGGLLRAVALIGAALSLLDEALLVSGALGSLVGLTLVAVAVRSRERRVYLEVAGGDDVPLPRGTLSGAEVSELSAAVSDGRPGFENRS